MSPRRMLVAVVAIGVVGLAVASPVRAQAPATGQVVVVHGLRGLVADIYVDGKVVLEAFQPERATDPLTLPAATYLVEIRGDDDAADATPLLTANLVLAAGDRLSAVAHLGTGGKPQLTVFNDNVAPVSAGRSRLVVRNTAAAPAFSVLLNGQAVARNEAPPGQSETEVSAAQYQISLDAAGRELAPAQDVPLAEGTVNFLYLIGSAEDNSLGWLANKVEGVGQAPIAVQTGDSGLADGRGAFPLVVVMACAVSALVALWVLLRPARGAPTGPA